MRRNRIHAETGREFNFTPVRHLLLYRFFERFPFLGDFFLDLEDWPKVKFSHSSLVSRPGSFSSRHISSRSCWLPQIPSLAAFQPASKSIPPTIVAKKLEKNQKIMPAIPQRIRPKMIGTAREPCSIVSPSPKDASTKKSCQGREIPQGANNRC